MTYMGGCQVCKWPWLSELGQRSTWCKITRKCMKTPFSDIPLLYFPQIFTGTTLYTLIMYVAFKAYQMKVLSICPSKVKGHLNANYYEDIRKIHRELI